MENLINNAPLIVVIGLLILGFVLLVKGADYFVEGSSSIAKRFHVPSIIIGLTIVAMGTSLPEASVSILASINGNNEIAISNALGSNIFNTMVVLGICSLMAPVLVKTETLKRDFPIAMLSTLLLFGAIVYDRVLGHLDGVIFLVIFIIYMFVLIRTGIKTNEEQEEVEKILSMPVSIVFIVLGAIAIVVGGDLTVDAASRIAMDFGMSETLVGLTIVSIGTSLPELVTSIVAARKKQVDMALGNAIGSNIFNILLVLGASSAISPIVVASETIMDIIILVVFTGIIWIFATTKNHLSKLEGGCTVALYIVYAVYIIIR